MFRIHRELEINFMYKKAGFFKSPRKENRHNDDDLIEIKSQTNTKHGTAQKILRSTHSKRIQQTNRLRSYLTKISSKK